MTFTFEIIFFNKKQTGLVWDTSFGCLNIAMYFSPQVLRFNSSAFSFRPFPNPVRPTDRQPLRRGQQHIRKRERLEEEETSGGKKGEGDTHNTMPNAVFGTPCRVKPPQRKEPLRRSSSTSAAGDEEKAGSHFRNLSHSESKYLVQYYAYMKVKGPPNQMGNSRC